MTTTSTSNIVVVSGRVDLAALSKFCAPTVPLSQEQPPPGLRPPPCGTAMRPQETQVRPRQETKPKEVAPCRRPVTVTEPLPQPVPVPETRRGQEVRARKRRMSPEDPPPPWRVQAYHNKLVGVSPITRQPVPPKFPPPERLMPNAGVPVPPKFPPPERLLPNAGVPDATLPIQRHPTPPEHPPPYDQIFKDIQDIQFQDREQGGSMQLQQPMFGNAEQCPVATVPPGFPPALPLITLPQGWTPRGCTPDVQSSIPRPTQLPPWCPLARWTGPCPPAPEIAPKRAPGTPGPKGKAGSRKLDKFGPGKVRS